MQPYANAANKTELATAKGGAVPLRGKVRRARFDDLAAIMDINDHIYEGYDYMPAMFYRFLHSKNHALYVYEEDGKLIALINYLFRHEDNMVVFLSGRVRSSYQGQGHTKPDESSLVAAMLKDNPHITKYYSATLYKPNIQRRTKDLHWKVVYIENFLHYHLQDRPRLERFLRQGSWRNGEPQPISISYSLGIEWLAKSDQLIRFLSKYSSEYVPIDTPWIPARVNKTELRHLFSVSNEVLVTMDLETTARDLVSSSTIAGTSKQNASNQKKRLSEIKGFSYSSSERCKLGQRVDIHFYGDDETILVNHIAMHLLRYLRMTKDDLTIGFILEFPDSIDARRFEETVREGFGDRIDSEEASVTKVIHYMADLAVPASKL